MEFDKINTRSISNLNFSGFTGSKNQAQINGASFLIIRLHQQNMKKNPLGFDVTEYMSKLSRRFFSNFEALSENFNFKPENFSCTIREQNVYFDFKFSGDDHQALIWDIQQMPRPIEDPILAYNAAEGEINQIQWGATQPDWIAICYNKNLEILRV